MQLWTLVAKSASHSTIYWTLKLSRKTCAHQWRNFRESLLLPTILQTEVALWKLAHTTLNGSQFNAPQLARYYLVNNIASTSTVFFTFAFTFISLNLYYIFMPCDNKNGREKNCTLFRCTSACTLTFCLYIMACVRLYCMSLPLSQAQVSLPH